MFAEKINNLKRHTWISSPSVITPSSLRALPLKPTSSCKTPTPNLLSLSQSNPILSMITHPSRICKPSQPSPIRVSFSPNRPKSLWSKLPKNCKLFYLRILHLIMSLISKSNKLSPTNSIGSTQKTILLTNINSP